MTSYNKAWPRPYGENTFAERSAMMFGKMKAIIDQSLILFFLVFTKETRFPCYSIPDRSIKIFKSNVDGKMDLIGKTKIPLVYRPFSLQ